MKLATEFDLGPLSWVQGEIDEALTRGTDALAAFRASPGDTVSLKHARAHVHQAAGAIQMVGLDAVVAFTDEIERQLVAARGTARRATCRPSCDLVDHAVSRLRVFLDEIVNGAPPVPLKLFARIRARCRRRAASRRPRRPTCSIPISTSRAPRCAAKRDHPGGTPASHLFKERRQYPARPARVAARRRCGRRR